GEALGAAENTQGLAQLENHGTSKRVDDSGTLCDYHAARDEQEARMRGLALGLLVWSAALVAAQEPERLADGVALTLGARRLELRACRDDVVRVIDAPPGAFFKRQSLMTVAGACQPTTFEVKPRPDGFDFVTKRLLVRVARQDGRLSFLDRAGRILIAERQGGA